MIEDKELGLKVADNPEERLWIGIKERAEQAILQSKAEIEIQKENLRLGEERLKIYRTTFSHKFWLLAFIIVAIFGISAGLIFVKNDIVSGMSLLSHVGAVVVGIIAGSGWERARGK